MEGRCGH